MAKPKTRKKLPPSRLLYEQGHPVIAIRVSNELHRQLLDIRETTGQSWVDLLKVALEIQKPILEPRNPSQSELDKEFEEGNEIGYETGWEEAKRRYLVSYPCSVCKVTIELESSAEKKQVTDHMTKRRWAHKKCLMTR